MIMNNRDLIGKKIYSHEDNLGEIVDIKKDPFHGTRDIAIIETEKNDFKAAPVEYLSIGSDKVLLNGDKKILENFPALSNNDIESNHSKFKQALTQHYGEAKYWNNEQKSIHPQTDQGYMGSSQMTDQEPDDNSSLKGKMDFDKIKRGEEQ